MKTIKYDAVLKAAPVDDTGKHAKPDGKTDGLARTLTPRSLPEELRPRERLLREGPAALSDRELLAILINTGVKGRNVSVLAGDIHEKLDADRDIPSAKELSAMTGIGKSRACSIIAMLEFGRRRWGGRGARIKTSADIFPLLRHYADKRKERFISVSLNGAHEVLAIRVVTVGLVNKSIVHPREVFADVITDRASAVCVAHNHPSGIVKPSSQDDEVTERLIEASNLLGINFLDHLVFTENEYYSYYCSGKIKRLPHRRGQSAAEVVV